LTVGGGGQSFMNMKIGLEKIDELGAHRDLASFGHKEE
jgi:hypothetical protein